jgi:hypothetical protein
VITSGRTAPISSKARRFEPHGQFFSAPIRVTCAAAWTRRRMPSFASGPETQFLIVFSARRGRSPIRRSVHRAAHLHPLPSGSLYAGHRHIGADGRNPHQRVGGRLRLADHLDVVRTGQRFVHAATDDLLIIEEKYSDFSLFAHAISLTRNSSRDLGGRDNVPVFRPPATL